MGNGRCALSIGLSGAGKFGQFGHGFYLLGSNGCVAILGKITLVATAHGDHFGNFLAQVESSFSAMIAGVPGGIEAPGHQIPGLFVGTRLSGQDSGFKKRRVHPIHGREVARHKIDVEVYGFGHKGGEGPVGRHLKTGFVLVQLIGIMPHVVFKRLAGKIHQVEIVLVLFGFGNGRNPRLLPEFFQGFG